MKFGFLKIESYKKGIIFSSAFNFLSKSLLFVQSLAIAYFFGAKEETDIYFFCLTTITLAALFISSLDSSVLIPESMRLIEQEDKKSSMRFLNFFIYLYTAGGVLATALLYLFPLKAFLLVSKFDFNTLERNKEILLLSIPVFTLMILTNLLVNILASQKFFTLPMIVGAVNGLLALLSLIIFHETLGVSSILIGTIVAYFINLSFLFLLMKRYLRWDFGFHKMRLASRIKKNILFAQAGNITSMIANYVPIYLLSSFGLGIITALTFGQKTSEIPNQLISLQFSSVIGIKFNELYSRGDLRKINEVFLHSSRVLFAITVPIAAVMFHFNYEIITLLFKRGEFTESIAQTSSSFFKYFVLLLPFYAVSVNLVSRLFMASQKIVQSFWYQILFNAILVLSYAIAVPLLGATGIPIALVFMHCGNLVVVYFLTRRFFAFINFKEALFFFLKICIINALPFLAVGYLKENMIIKGPSLVTLLGGSCVYTILLVFLIYVTGIYRHFLKTSQPDRTPPGMSR